MNINPKDPLASVNGFVPTRERELFKAFCQAAHGHDGQDVFGASINMVLNVIRQSCPTQAQAAKMFDEIAAKAKHLLLEAHYHGDGKRKNIFPYTQVLTVNEVFGNVSKVNKQ